MLSPSHLPELTTEQMLRKDLKTLSNDELVLAISGIYIDLEVRRSEGKQAWGSSAGTAGQHQHLSSSRLSCTALTCCRTWKLSARLGAMLGWWP